VAVAPHLQGRQAGRQCQARQGQAEMMRRAGAAGRRHTRRATVAEAGEEACMLPTHLWQIQPGQGLLGQQLHGVPLQSLLHRLHHSVYLGDSQQGQALQLGRTPVPLQPSPGSKRQKQGQDDAQTGRQAGGQAAGQAEGSAPGTAWSWQAARQPAAGAHLRHAAGHQQPLACLAPCAQACVHGRLAGALDGAGVQQPQVCAVTL
jgi:hypothetical protein